VLLLVVLYGFNQVTAQVFGLLENFLRGGTDVKVKRLRGLLLGDGIKVA